MLFGPSSICYLKYLNNCVSPFFVEASYYTTPIGSLSHDNPFGETSYRASKNYSGEISSKAFLTSFFPIYIFLES